MVAWHHSKGVDIGFRGIGLLLCVIAYLAIFHLIAIQPPLPDQTVGVESFLLAAVGFLSASAGSAMTLLGNHLFDHVEVSSRWGSGRMIPLDEEPRIDGSTSRDTNTTGWNARLGQAGGRSLKGSIA